jgi:hypothetical protein
MHKNVKKLLKELLYSKFSRLLKASMKYFNSKLSIILDIKTSFESFQIESFDNILKN